MIATGGLPIFGVWSTPSRMVSRNLMDGTVVNEVTAKRSRGVKHVAELRKGRSLPLASVRSIFTPRGSLIVIMDDLV